MSDELLSRGVLERSRATSKLSYSFGTCDGYDVKVETRGYLLSINLKSSTTDLAIGSDKLRPVFTPTGSMIFSPPSVDVREVACAGFKDHFFMEFQPESFVDDLSALGVRLGGFDLTRPFKDPVSLTLAKEVRRHLLAGEREGPLYLDDLTSLIFRRCLVALGLDENKPSDLSQSNFTQIRGYIDAHLGENLTLDGVAAVIGMPSRSFANAFREKAGQGLAAFVLEKRIARARQMLANTNEPLASIAYACGFSSQQHMTNSFTSKLGITPRRYRREVCK